MGSIGFPEIAIILVIALLVLGPKRLPEAGRSLGRGMREFKENLSAANPLNGEAGETVAELKSYGNEFADELKSQPAMTTSEQLRKQNS